jgi:hypothetical protein
MSISNNNPLKENDITIIQTMIQSTFEEDHLVHIQDFDFWDVMDLKSLLIQLNCDKHGGNFHVDSDHQYIVESSFDSEKVINLFHRYSSTQLRFALNRYELNKLWDDFQMTVNLLEVHTDMGEATEEMCREDIQELINMYNQFKDRLEYRKIMMGNVLYTFHDDDVCRRMDLLLEQMESVRKEIH